MKLSISKIPAGINIRKLKCLIKFCTFCAFVIFYNTREFLSVVVYFSIFLLFFLFSIDVARIWKTFLIRLTKQLSTEKKTICIIYRPEDERVSEESKLKTAKKISENSSSLSLLCFFWSFFFGCLPLEQILLRFLYIFLFVMQSLTLMWFIAIIYKNIFCCCSCCSKNINTSMTH